MGLYAIGMQDVHGDIAGFSFNVDTDADAKEIIEAFRGASNAKVVDISKSRPIVMSSITDNNTDSGNADSVLVKMGVTFIGTDLDPAAPNKTPTVHIGIPAPKMAMYPYTRGVGLGATLDGLAPQIMSNSGVTMSEVKKVKPKRGR